MEVIVTFGQSHTHRVNNRTFDCNCVAVIKCDDYEQGRKLAFTYFNDKWHQCVPRDKWNKEHMIYFPRGYMGVN